MREAGDIEKATHFLKLSNLLSGQLKNLENAVNKCRLEEELIQKISIEARKNMQGGDHISLSELDDSFSSQQSNEFLKILQSEMVDEGLPLMPLESIKRVTE